MLRVNYDNMLSEFKRILLVKGLNEKKADIAAKIFADNSLDGIYSHGYIRFLRVISYIEAGEIELEKDAECVASFGAMERWEGYRGFGPLNANLAMDRACELAKEFGIGIVALGNSNHWMRGGSYGWQAANKGMISISWSNTMPNMPAWGGKDRKIGNNPIVIAIPRENGNHIVIDSALSQFSYGKIEECRLKGVKLPVYGGYDSEGKLTTDPLEIEKTMRILPMGYWKGSGISIAIDLIATILSAGNSVKDIGEFKNEVGLSQVFIAIDPKRFSTDEEIEGIIDNIIKDIKTSVPVDESKEVYYPGERSLMTRLDNLKNGIPVIEEVWNKILAL